MDFFILLRMWLDQLITDEQVEYLYGQDTLDRLHYYLTDPFDEVLGG